MTHRSKELKNNPCEGNMNVCTKFYGSPSNGCRDISFRMTNNNLLVALWAKSGVVQTFTVHRGYILFCANPAKRVE